MCIKCMCVYVCQGLYMCVYVCMCGMCVQGMCGYVCVHVRVLHGRFGFLYVQYGMCVKGMCV